MIGEAVLDLVGGPSEGISVYRGEGRMKMTVNVEEVAATLPEPAPVRGVTTMAGACNPPSGEIGEVKRQRPRRALVPPGSPELHPAPAMASRASAQCLSTESTLFGGTDAAQASPRCRHCGALIAPAAPSVPEYLTLAEIMARYKVKRTKALELRRDVRRRYPDAVRSHGRCIRVASSALERVWARG